MRLGICAEKSLPVYENAAPEQTEYSGIADELLYGWLFQIDNETEDYFYITTFYGYHGWIKKESCFVGYSEDRRKCLHYVDGSFVDVLAIPDVNGRKLLTLYRGSLIQVLQKNIQQSGWAKVCLMDGTIGYLRTKFLREREDNDSYLLYGNSLAYINPRMIRENVFRKMVVEAAMQYMGAPYRWAGKTDAGIDCSGLAFMAYQKNGVLIYRDAQIKEGFPVQEICLCEMKMGDLLYFPGHMAIYWRCGKYIHATAQKDSSGVVVSSLREEDYNFRRDLKESLVAVGSIFGRNM